MEIIDFIEKLRKTPNNIEFTDTIDVIETHYNFTPTTFINGDLTNEAGQNSGSCKLFSFAKLHELDKEETLHCFGAYYQDVLSTPNGEDHQNIRNFMMTGWDGVSFTETVLVAK